MLIKYKMNVLENNKKRKKKAIIKYENKTEFSGLV